VGVCILHQQNIYPTGWDVYDATVEAAYGFTIESTFPVDGFDLWRPSR
jgi:hypothetical protein